MMYTLIRDKFVVNYMAKSCFLFSLDMNYRELTINYSCNDIYL